VMPYEQVSLSFTVNVQFVQRLARLDTWVFVASRLLTLCV